MAFEAKKPSVDSAVAMNDSLRALLECPVCLEYCKTPIFMCSNGHNVCNTCQPSLSSCPTCRVDGRPSVRCPLLEKMTDQVTMPCANASEGCTKFLNAEDMAKHWIFCEDDFIDHCRVFVSNRLDTFESCCGWEGIRSALVAHVKKAHPAFYSEEKDFQKRVSIDFEMDTGCGTLVSAYNELFWVIFKYIAREKMAYVYSQMAVNKRKAHYYAGKFTYESAKGYIVNKSYVNTMGWVRLGHGSLFQLKLSKAMLKDFVLDGVFKFNAQILKR